MLRWPSSHYAPWPTMAITRRQLRRLPFRGCLTTIYFSRRFRGFSPPRAIPRIYRYFSMPHIFFMPRARRRARRRMAIRLFHARQQSFREASLSPTTWHNIVSTASKLSGDDADDYIFLPYARHALLLRMILVEIERGLLFDDDLRIMIDERYCDRLYTGVFA